MTQRIRLSAFLLLVAAIAVGWEIINHPVPLAQGAALPVEPAKPTPDPEPQNAVPQVRDAPASTVTTKIAADCPAIYRTACVPGHVPIEILSDGTQIYDDIPYKARQPDGTMKEFKTRMSIQPTKPVPVLIEDEPAPRR